MQLLGDAPSPFPTHIHRARVWGWEMVLPGTSSRPLCRDTHRCLLAGSRVWFDVPALLSAREGKVQAVCPLLRQKVLVAVLASWGVISIVCRRRLFLSAVNSLNSNAVWSLVQPARRPTGRRPPSRDHDLDLDSNARGNSVYKACLMCF